VPLRAGCRPHRRDDATLSALAVFPAEGESPGALGDDKREANQHQWTHGGSSRGRSGPRSDPAQALPWRPRYTRSVRHRCLTLRTSWRRDMFAGNVVAVKSVAAFSPCGHSMSSQTASRCEGSTRSSCASTTRSVAKRDDISPSFLLARSPAESHLARWRRPDHRPPRGHRCGVPANPGATPWSYGVSRRRSPDPRSARAGETRSCRHTRCRPAPAQPATRPQWHARSSRPQLGAWS